MAYLVIYAYQLRHVFQHFHDVRGFIRARAPRGAVQFFIVEQDPTTASLVLIGTIFDNLDHIPLYACKVAGEPFALGGRDSRVILGGRVLGGPRNDPDLVTVRLCLVYRRASKARFPIPRATSYGRVSRAVMAGSQSATPYRSAIVPSMSNQILIRSFPLSDYIIHDTHRNTIDYLGKLFTIFHKYLFVTITAILMPRNNDKTICLHFIRKNFFLFFVSIFAIFVNHLYHANTPFILPLYTIPTGMQ